jgi:two-component system NtrC family response regulator
MLAARFLQTVAQMYRREPPSLTDSANGWLQTQAWPGNVRQLRQSVERTMLVSGRTTLDADDFARTSRMDLEGPATDPLPPVGAMTIDEIERGMIVKALRHHGGNISRVAESLGLSRAALYRRLEKYEIQA